MRAAPGGSARAPDGARGALRVRVADQGDLGERVLGHAVLVQLLNDRLQPVLIVNRNQRRVDFFGSHYRIDN